MRIAPHWAGGAHTWQTVCMGLFVGRQGSRLRWGDPASIHSGWHKLVLRGSKKKLVNFTMITRDMITCHSPREFIRESTNVYFVVEERRREWFHSVSVVGHHWQSANDPCIVHSQSASDPIMYHEAIFQCAQSGASPSLRNFFLFSRHNAFSVLSQLDGT